MSAARTRFLRPSVLVVLPSGLWALDEFHPVAAVLDPDTGALRRVVSWSEAPVAPADHGGYLPLVHSDGTALWVQHDREGPVLRVDEDGLRAAVWTDGFELEACGPGVAWCVARPWIGWAPRQEDRPWLARGRLLRIDGDGDPTLVSTHGDVARVKAGPDALHVQLAVPPTDGAGSGIDPPLDWVSLRWDRGVPDTIVPPAGLLQSPFFSVPAAGAPGPTPGVHDGDEPDWDSSVDLAWDRVGRGWHGRHETPPLPSAVTTDGHRWSVGTVPTAHAVHRDRRRLRVTAHTADGTEVRRWDLGPGPEVLSTISLGDRLAVIVARPDGSSEVLALHPDSDEVTVLLGPDTVDIADLGWPMVTQPVHAESYAAQVRDLWSHLDFGDGRLFDERATLLGQWPNTQLEWTFRWSTRPGLILRRRVDLFDDLGRIDHPENATTYLMETVEGGGIPAADDAVNGYLDL